MSRLLSRVEKVGSSGSGRRRLDPPILPKSWLRRASLELACGLHSSGLEMAKRTRAGDLPQGASNEVWVMDGATGMWLHASVELRRDGAESVAPPSGGLALAAEAGSKDPRSS